MSINNQEMVVSEYIISGVTSKTSIHSNKIL